ncbi:unnamed protein product [Urochloa humidicola]
MASSEAATVDLSRCSVPGQICEETQPGRRLCVQPPLHSLPVAASPPHCAAGHRRLLRSRRAAGRRLCRQGPRAGLRPRARETKPALVVVPKAASRPCAVVARPDGRRRRASAALPVVRRERIRGRDDRIYPWWCRICAVAAPARRPTTAPSAVPLRRTRPPSVDSSRRRLPRRPPEFRRPCSGDGEGGVEGSGCPFFLYKCRCDL